MPKLRRLTAREITAVLERVGFSLTRQSGSHQIFKNAAGKRATVPVHGSRILHPKVLKSIMRDAELSFEAWKGCCVDIWRNDTAARLASFDDQRRPMQLARDPLRGSEMP